MDRLEQLLHYYTKCRRGAILQQWRELYDTKDITVTEAVNLFHELILTDLQEHTKWYNSVFHPYSTNSSSILLSTYSQVLSSLDPSPLYNMESLIKKSSASHGLLQLQQLKSSTDRLVQGLEAYLKDCNVEKDVLFHFGESLFQLFRLLMSNRYKALSQQYFSEHVVVTVGCRENREKITESIHMLRQSHSKINSVMESSLNSCLTLSHGCGLELLVEVC